METKKPTYTMTIKMVGTPWNWNLNHLNIAMKNTRSQAMVKELEKIDARVSNMDLTNIKEIIMKIANKKLDS